MSWASWIPSTFNQLTLTSQVLSGTGSASIVNGDLRVTSNVEGDVVVRVTVEDPSGLSDQDSTVVHFIDNAEPTVVDFFANPDNGQAPLTTSFTVNVQDADNDNLECSIFFGDGQNTGTPQDCDSLNGVQHTYQNVGTYVATLNVYDGVNPVVQAQETIFVFDSPTGVPIIDFFTLSSSNGNFVPTDLTFSWNARHTTNQPINCLLEIIIIS